MLYCSGGNKLMWESYETSNMVGGNIIKYDNNGKAWHCMFDDNDTNN